MAFRVEVTPEAECDGDSILAWLLSHEAGETGIRWFLALEDAIASLASLPTRCALRRKISILRLRFATCYTDANLMCIGFYSRSKEMPYTSYIFVMAAVNPF